MQPFESVIGLLVKGDRSGVNLLDRFAKSRKVEVVRNIHRIGNVLNLVKVSTEIDGVLSQIERQDSAVNQSQGDETKDLGCCSMFLEVWITCKFVAVNVSQPMTFRSERLDQHSPYLASQV